MREKLRRLCRWSAEAFNRVRARYGIELLLILYGCVGCIVGYHLDRSLSDEWMPRVALAPLFLFLALAINTLGLKGPWRWLYRLCWLPIVPLSFCSGLPAWIETKTFLITLIVLAPLAVLIARRESDNRRFVSNVVTWVRSGVLALVFTNVALGLFCAILYSTAYIFGVQGAWVADVAMHALILCQTLGVPLLLLMLADQRIGTEERGGSVIGVLVNYLFTPALLIYAGILYLYVLKILLAWSLPVGGVAYMVFGFTILAMVIKALRELLDRRICDWFFDRFSLFALPPVVLFWVGVAERVGEYGLTTERVWLILCGGVMTLSLALFVARRTGRYLYVALGCFAVFAAVLYVPAWSPRQMSLNNQTHRVKRIARSLGVLDAQGKISLETVSRADTTQWREYKRLWDALEYLYSARYDENEQSASQALFGIEAVSELRAALPRELYERMIIAEEWSDVERRIEHFYVSASSSRATDLNGYSHLISNIQAYGDSLTYDFDRDTLRIRFGDMHPEFRISGHELIQRQLHRAEVEHQYNQELLDERAEQFLTYTDDDVTILFSSLAFERDSVPELQQVAIDAVLIR